MLLVPRSDEHVLIRKLECSTHGVSKESRAPSREDTTHPLSTTNLPPGLEVALIHLRIDLTTAFDQIQRRHGRMCNALPSS